MAVSTYFFNPDDIVWVVVRHHASKESLERIVFGAGTFLFLSCAAMETWPARSTDLFDILYT